MNIVIPHYSDKYSEEFEIWFDRQVVGISETEKFTMANIFNNCKQIAKQAAWMAWCQQRINTICDGK